MRISATDRTAQVLLASLLAAALHALPPSARAQEIGANDFRISFVGGTGDASRDGRRPAVAYDPHLREYLVVWAGDHTDDQVFEIWGQRLDASGERIGDPLQISIAEEDSLDRGAAPDLAYNTTDREYLVVWYGSATGGGRASGEVEVFGQRLESDGSLLGAVFPISDMGGVGDLTYQAFFPAVAYNATDNEYLVVWYGDDDVGGLVDGEDEIFGQRLSAVGAELGANDFRISDMGDSGDADYVASAPRVAYNSTENEYLVVWHGDDNVGGLVDNELEIFGQRLNAATGTALGDNDFRISDMGDTGDASYDARRPAVAYNVTRNEYLVVWDGGDDVGGLVAGELEIFGQRLDGATATELGTNDFRISSMGGTGVVGFDGTLPAVAFNSSSDAYLVVWIGDDDVGGLADDEREAFAQYVSGAGAIQSPNDFRISDMAGTGENPFGVLIDLFVAASDREFLIVWEGDDDVGGLVENENEIFGQRLVGSIEVVAENLDCQLFPSIDLPKPIPQGAGTAGLTMSTLEVAAADGGVIGDLDISELFGTHTAVYDLEMFLESPSGDLIQLHERSCPKKRVGDFDLQFDDQAPPGNPPCPPVDGAAYQPFEGLATFFGEESAGTWTLVILDTRESETGQLDGWSLEICTTYEETIFSDGFETGDTAAW